MKDQFTHYCHRANLMLDMDDLRNVAADLRFLIVLRLVHSHICDLVIGVVLVLMAKWNLCLARADLEYFPKGSDMQPAHLLNSTNMFVLHGNLKPCLR